MDRRMLVDLNTCKSTEIQKSGFTVGSEESMVDMYIFSPAVSRMHCRIIIREGQSYIVDLNSLNGTSVNGVRLSPNQEYPLTTKSVIRFAAVQYLYIEQKEGE